jgi:hypothetical protein
MRDAFLISVSANALRIACFLLVYRCKIEVQARCRYVSFRENRKFATQLLQLHVITRNADKIKQDTEVPVEYVPVE